VSTKKSPWKYISTTEKTVTCAKRAEENENLKNRALTIQADRKSRIPARLGRMIIIDAPVKARKREMKGEKARRSNTSTITRIRMVLSHPRLTTPVMERSNPWNASLQVGNISQESASLIGANICFS
jgi:hypothetical protein